MFRQPTTKASQKANNPNTRNNNHDNANSASPSTIREIRSRTASSTNNTRQLLANRRLAMSMDRLNSPSSTNAPSTSTITSSMHGINTISDKETIKSPLNSGSSTSINGSTTSPPSRASSASSNGGLNRTASRVSRFRSAKAVFERLSSANSSNNSGIKAPDSNGVTAKERPKVNSTIVSRYAMARNASTPQQPTSTSITSTRSRFNSSKSTTSSRSQSSTDITNKSPSSSGYQQSPKHELVPRPQPRVIATKRTTLATQPNTSTSSCESSIPASKNKTTSENLLSKTTQLSANTASTHAKPPPKDLIDKIVLEIARDANKTHDLDCTIQDLSNCDISGIPETMDFDKCFQDVEMMTEEEARKLLSRKSDSPASSLSNAADTKQQANTQDETKLTLKYQSDDANKDVVVNLTSDIPLQQAIAEVPVLSNKSNDSQQSTTVTAKAKVRFSDKPAIVYDTHAVEDYDRRNDDIDPIAASAEYEMEKSREREGLGNDEDGDENDLVANQDVEGYIQSDDVQNVTQANETNAEVDTSNCEKSDHFDGPQLRSALRQPDGQSRLEVNLSSQQQLDGGDVPTAEQVDCNRKEYIESLEREVSLKRILEQNLRDLQSQYYETVKQLDSHKGESEIKLTQMEQSFAEMSNKLESLQNELSDSRGIAQSLEKQINEMKESSQLLEKKYHRAKKIIKDMQSREDSFTRREQLYQQKLDEIEHELSSLISTFDRTIFDEGLKYFSINDVLGCTTNHTTSLDVFGLLRHVLTNFQASQPSQSAQIKQRIVSMFEQHLASLIARSNNCTSVSSSQGPTIQSSSKSALAGQELVESSTTKQHPFANRLSHPNLPYPIGVGGQPTKIFHGLGPASNTLVTNEPSPPQSVNSYPSSNSLNSLNNNQTTAVNNNIVPSKHQASALSHDASQTTTSTTLGDEFQPTDIQAPFRTNEWHDKPVSEWNTTQVSTWLLALGLDQYISKFEDRNVNGQSLINLDSTVLKGLGVLNSNDRNLLKKKIRELRVEMEKERKQFEKKLKENLKDRSKSMQATSSQNTNGKSSWKKGLLS